MSKQRERHQARMPHEEAVRQAVIGALAKADSIEVKRSGFGAFDPMSRSGRDCQVFAGGSDGDGVW